MYFNQADTLRDVSNANVVAFEFAAADGIMEPHKDSHEISALPSLPRPVSPCPRAECADFWQYSSCSLENVVAIQLCVETPVRHQPVVGMLVSYADGHKECVGQWRFDWASKPIDTSGTDGLHICHQRTRYLSSGRHRYIGIVAVRTELRQTSPVADGEWSAVGWTGTLEWWFSRRYIWLYHNGVRL